MNEKDQKKFVDQFYEYKHPHGSDWGDRRAVVFYAIISGYVAQLFQDLEIRDGKGVMQEDRDEIAEACRPLLETIAKKTNRCILKDDIGDLIDEDGRADGDAWHDPNKLIKEKK